MYIDFDDQPPYYDEISDISGKPIATLLSVMDISSFIPKDT